MSIKSRHPNFTPPSPSVDAKVNAILSTLSTEEKIRLLGGNLGDGMTLAVPEKGVPNFRMADGPVGIHWWTKESTAYPACIALAASWDVGLAEKFGQALGRDCRARGIHILLAPGVNLYRAAQCGRNFEYLGEDPWLAGKLVSSIIRGIQDMSVAATVKHFACNFQEYDRHAVSTDADERTLREVYLRAFEMAIKEGGAACLMTAYNLVNGQHCSEHEWLIKTVLKEEWGFSGLVMSDWDSCYNAVMQANNGLDLEMPWGKHMNAKNLLPALEKGLVSMATIDEKVRRLLRLGVCFGWLEHEQKDESIPYRDPVTEAAALEVARRGVVLLQNKKLADGTSALPFEAAKVKRLAVIGCHAEYPTICGGGSAYTPPHRVVKLLDAIKDQVSKDTVITYHMGVDLYRAAKAFEASEFTQPNGAAGLFAEYFNNRELAGIPALTRAEDRCNIAWYDGKSIGEGVDRWNFSARWSGFLTPKTTEDHCFFAKAHDAFFRVYLDGEILMDSGKIPEGRVYTTIKRLEAGRAYAVKVEYRQDRGYNAMRFGWEPVRAAFSDFDAAIQAAKAADAVVLTAGFTADDEAEGYDRPFALSAVQEELIRKVGEANPRTAVVLTAGGAVSVENWLDSVGALLHAWYPGQEGNLATAETLFGKNNPGAHLPFTWEKNAEDRGSAPWYLDTDGDKRVFLGDGIFHGYRHFDKNGILPRFPFGFGLSFTEFSLSDLRLSTPEMVPNTELRVSVRVKNTGKRSGTTVVQLYVADTQASLPRPPKDLRAFSAVELMAGEEKEVAFTLNQEALAFYNSNTKRWQAEAGEFMLMVGFNASDLPLRSVVRFTETVAF